MPPFSQTLVSCSLLLLLTFLLAHLRKRRANPRNLPLPPGPPPLPIVGNAHQAPKQQDWLRYTEWGRIYGPIVHFRLYRHPVILLNTHKAAVDLFDKRSAIYSDRPRLIMAADLIGWGQGVALGQSGPRHRKHRRLLSTSLNPLAARSLHPLQESGALAFLVRLARGPQHFFHHIRTSVSETIVMAAFGHECDAEAFPYVDMAERAHEHVTKATSPGAYAVDSLPWLQYVPEWFPGAGFKKQARIWRAELEELARFPFETVKNDLKNGTAHPSYVAHHIDTDHPLSRDDEEQIMWSATSLYTGGVDTTAAALTTFVLAMTLHPHAQARAQRELDTVVGAERLPTLADRPRLPYVEALVWEVGRWHPVAPLGVSHRANQSDYYEGYYIPEDATVVSNIWAMSRDESIYPNPEQFIPERFLPHDYTDADTSTNTNAHTLPSDAPPSRKPRTLTTPASRTSNPSPPTDPNPNSPPPLNAAPATPPLPQPPSLIFGFGRRICPGMHMADASLFIYVARTLATFSIAKPVDPDTGAVVQPEVDWVSGLISHPKPFKCDIKIRSQAALQLIQAQAQARTPAPHAI